MALTLEDAVKTKARCRDFTRNPGIALQLKAFWKYQSEHGSAKQFQMTAFGDLGADAVAADVACKLYLIYLKKQNTATDAFVNIFNDATNDATAGDAFISIGLTVGNDEVLLVYPNGLALSAGAVYGSYTALIGANGSTPSTSGDGPNGFLIVGAA